jgi:hypothetical protein
MFNKSLGIVIPDFEPEPVIEALKQKDDYLIAAIFQLERRRQKFTNKLHKMEKKAEKKAEKASDKLDFKYWIGRMIPTIPFFDDVDI